MWTVRNNLKGALKFTDIFIGGKPIVLKSRGFLDLDLIDGGRQAAEMSEQLKRCYDESYIRDIHRTNTPEEKVQMNLRDLENIAQRTEIEELKIKLQDGGSKMDQILAAINQQSELPGNPSDLLALKEQLESVIDQIQNVAPAEVPQGATEQEVSESEKQVSASDYRKALEESNQQLRELLKAQDQKIDNLGKLLQTQQSGELDTTQGNELLGSILDSQSKRIDALMDKLQQLQDDQAFDPEQSKIAESEFDFNEQFSAFENSVSDFTQQLSEIKELKSLLLKQKALVDLDALETPDQFEQQKQQLKEVMELIQHKEESIFSDAELKQQAQDHPELMNQQDLLNGKLDQITLLLEQQAKKEPTSLQESNLATQNLEKQLEQQREQIEQLTTLLTQQAAPKENPNSALEQQLAQQQEQIKQLTDLLIQQQVKETPQPVVKEERHDEAMHKNMALQNEQLLNISNTIKELKEKDDARHEDMIDLKVLMAQHQNGNTFSRVVKTLSATDIEAALKVSDQIDDRIKDKQFEVTKKTKQKVDHPDVSELLGNTDLDFD